MRKDQDEIKYDTLLGVPPIDAAAVRLVYCLSCSHTCGAVKCTFTSHFTKLTTYSEFKCTFTSHFTI